MHTFGIASLLTLYSLVLKLWNGSISVSSILNKRKHDDAATHDERARRKKDERALHILRMLPQLCSLSAVCLTLSV
jgi:hypothetical protein